MNEIDINNQPLIPSRRFLKSFVIISIAIVSLLIGGMVGYVFGSKTSVLPLPKTTIQPAQTNTDFKATNSIDGIIYLMKYRGAGSANEKTIFITKDNTGESLKIADINMSESSVKQLFKYDFPAVVGFNPPINIINNFMIVPIAGGDANDIMIFNLNGNAISKGTREGNPELSNWMVSYDEWVKDNIIKVKLFQIDNSSGTAQVDLSTGKMVPGSYVKLGNLQE